MSRQCAGSPAAGLALVIDGRPRGEAAAVAGMDRQTLCDWVHRYNASGVEGLERFPIVASRLWVTWILKTCRMGESP